MDNDTKEIRVIILAAGSSERMGKPKQLLHYNDKTLLRHAVDTVLAAAIGPVVVVTGALNEELLPELDQAPVNVIHNPEWRSGMASSIQTGLSALEHITVNQLQGVLIMLCDQPLITPEHLNKLANQFSLIPAQYMIATAYDGISGVPAIFGSAMFPHLKSLTGDHGARQLFTQHRDRLIAVSFEDAAIDVDTEEDYERLVSE